MKKKIFVTRRLLKENEEKLKELFEGRIDHFDKTLIDHIDHIEDLVKK